MFRIYRVMRHRIGIDGEGITSLIGLTGCPLSCKYCLNKKVLESKREKDVSPRELLDTVIQDACYMIATNGGVTFGGGEPLLQYKDMIEFAKLKPCWMHLNVETALQAPAEAVEELLPYVDYWIADVKTLDASLYKEYTGKAIDTMLCGLDILAEHARDKCLIRVPIIPGFKDREKAIFEEQILKEKGFNNIDVFEYINV